MPRGLSISTYVDITTAIAAGGVLRTEFGTGLLITTDDAIPAGGPDKMQAFADRDGVNAAFDAGDALSGASIWFARAGVRSLYIGRWAPTDISTTLRGGAPAALGSLTIANATFSVLGADVTADFSADTSYADIAAGLQAALSSGRVASATIGAGGTSYVQATTTVAFTGGGAARQATGTVVVTAGAVTAITITDAGSGYTSAPTVTITGAGTGATATANLGAIAAQLSGATVTYTNSRFLLGLSGADAVGFFAPHSLGSGTDVSGLLGMTAAAGAVSAQGHDAETLTDSIGEMIDLAVGGAPVALMLAGDAPLTYSVAGETYDSRTEAAAFAQGGDYVFGLLDTSDQVLVTGDDLSHAALAFERQQDKVEPLYSMDGERPEIGLLALMSSQNLNQPASIITPHLKSIPGVRPTNITETQRRELERKRTNVYTTVGGLPSLVGGFTGKAGSWLDAVWWLLWLKNEMELNIFNAQKREPALQHGDSRGRATAGDGRRGQQRRRHARRAGQRQRASGHHRDHRQLRV